MPSGWDLKYGIQECISSWYTQISDYMIFSTKLVLSTGQLVVPIIIGWTKKFQIQKFGRTA